MGTGNHSPEPFEEETRHKQLVWEEFLVNAVEAANKSIQWLELDDLNIQSASESDIETLYNQRWASTGDVVISVLNFLWPEIESLAIKLGVPFQPEIGEIHSEQ